MRFFLPFTLYTLCLGLWISMGAIFSHAEYQNRSHVYDECEPDVFGLTQFYAFVTNFAFFISSLVSYIRFHHTEDPLFFSTAITSMFLCFMSSFYHGANDLWLSGPLDIFAITVVQTPLLYASATHQHYLTKRVLFDYTVLAAAFGYIIFQAKEFHLKEYLLQAIVGVTVIYLLKQIYQQFPRVRFAVLYLSLITALAVVEFTLLYKGCRLGRFTHGVTHLINAFIINFSVECLYHLRLQREHLKLVRQHSSREEYFQNV